MMHPIENMMRSSMEQIREMVDVNTIIGDAVHTPEGAVILPVSKVSFGFVSGGGEYGQGGSIRETSKDLTENPFAGGSGAGICLQPVGFVVVNGENIRLLPVQSESIMDHLADMVPQMFQFFKDCLQRKDAAKEETKKNSSYVSQVMQQQTANTPPTP
jgi:sporulation protein YtfJ